MKAIMYHYVRRFDPRYPHFRFLDIEHFRKQLDYLEATFGFASRRDWYSMIKGEQVSEPKKVILTFDDAMCCHYDFVFHELKNRNLFGIFFVPTAPYRENILLDVHRIHHLCGVIDGQKLLSVATALIEPFMISDSKREDFSKETYQKQSNYEGVSTFKRLLNYFVDYTYRSEIIDNITRFLKIELPKSEFYVSRENLRQMKRSGMIIGSHTDSHPVMSKLPLDEQITEIELSFEVLESIVGSDDMRAYCHPYGGFHSFDRNTLAALRQGNVDYAFNVESRDINNDDFIQGRLQLPRYDCNEFKFGVAS